MAFAAVKPLPLESLVSHVPTWPFLSISLLKIQFNVEMLTPVKN